MMQRGTSDASTTEGEVLCSGGYSQPSRRRRLIVLVCPMRLRALNHRNLRVRQSVESIHQLVDLALDGICLRGQCSGIGSHAAQTVLCPILRAFATRSYSSQECRLVV